MNQYGSVGGVSTAYDPKGSLTTLSGNSYTFGADKNTLTTGGGSSFWHDALRRITYLTDLGLRFDYEGDKLVAIYDSSNNLVRRYVFGPGTDEPVVWYEGTGTTGRRYLDADDRGSIIRVTDAGGGGTYRVNNYDEFGNPGPSNLGRFQYTGQVWLPEISMYYYKARIYSPSIGRFMQTDPIGYKAGLNWYNYASNDPINGSDPSGTVTLLSGCFTFGGLGETQIPGNIGVSVCPSASDLAATDTRRQTQSSDTAQSQDQSDGPPRGEPQNGVNSTDDMCCFIFVDRSRPPPPMEEAQGRAHSRIQEPGPSGRYTTYDEGGNPVLQYRGSGKPHGGIPRPNVKIYRGPVGPRGPVQPRAPVFRPAYPEEGPSFRLLEDPFLLDTVI